VHRTRPGARLRDIAASRSARIIAAAHAFVQNLRRGHYELATDVPARHRLYEVFDQYSSGTGSLPAQPDRPVGLRARNCRLAAFVQFHALCENYSRYFLAARDLGSTVILVE
jgi:hypothetical protein